LTTWQTGTAVIYYITEINTIPGSLAFYLWENAGISYRELIEKMISYAEKSACRQKPVKLCLYQ
jgi:D-alanine-D-alanine ligase and related ATP-grasp enzymes